MRLNSGLHLAYCTNVHPGESWAETLDSLERWTLPVKRTVSPNLPYAIGLRLSDKASRELAVPETLLAFQRWLERNGCYVFTINGFPFGQFHGTRVKEDVYRPDWTDARRLEYTNRLFDLLARLLPPGIGGSVSTVPGSFKEFIRAPEQALAIRSNLWRCIEHVAALSAATGLSLHLGLEPEPFGFLENAGETIEFFEVLGAEHPGDSRLARHLGVNYDTCHFAVEFEEPARALDSFQQRGIRLSKIHVSNALRLRPGKLGLARLASFADDTYLHQVFIRDDTGAITKFKELDDALLAAARQPGLGDAEWRIHFHVPLHTTPSDGFDTTVGHLMGALQWLQGNTGSCSHLEMETYTWAVLPEPLKARDVREQLVQEYRWVLARLAELGLTDANQPGT
jgi:sugar phosphate isomerase/epimerase